MVFIPPFPLGVATINQNAIMLMIMLWGVCLDYFFHLGVATAINHYYADDYAGVLYFETTSSFGSSHTYSLLRAYTHGCAGWWWFVAASVSFPSHWPFVVRVCLD